MTLPGNRSRSYPEVPRNKGNQGGGAIVLLQRLGVLLEYVTYAALLLNSIPFFPLPEVDGVK